MFEKRNGDQTMKWAYDQICAGGRPWTALGNFMNAWYGYATDRRANLISEPITQPEKETTHLRHWGAFCAASVEFLCERYNIPCPGWVHHPRYILSEPWYGELQDLNKAIPPEPTCQHYINTSPASFTRRNIFSGDRLFRNKYEMSAWIDEARAKGLTNRMDILRYATTKENSIHSS